MNVYQSIDRLKAYSTETYKDPSRDEPQLCIMMVARVAMGTSLLLFAEEEYDRNEVTMDITHPTNGTTKTDTSEFGYAERDLRSSTDSQPLAPHEMPSMTNLRDRYDSITVRGWSRASSSQADTSGGATANPNSMRYVEVVVYDDATLNALPEMLLVYRRAFDKSKPYGTQDGKRNTITNWHHTTPTSSQNYTFTDEYPVDRFKPQDTVD